jgi:serine/threonine-protein kinase
VKTKSDPVTEKMEGRDSRPAFTNGCGKLAIGAVALILFVGVFWGGNRLFGHKQIQSEQTPPPVVGATITQLTDKVLVVALPQSTVTLEMVYVPAGTFSMGSEEEKPVHDVYLNSFWIDRTEVTNAQFGIFVETTAYVTTSERNGAEEFPQQTAGNSLEVKGFDWQHPQGPYSDIENRDDHPVVQVSWDDAATYCQWRGARLPTEAEWEKAARSSDGRIFPWGNEYNGIRLNFCDANCANSWRDTTIDDQYEGSAPVGSYPGGVSPYGALDMAGNVYEWAADWYDHIYYEYSPSENPRGPTDEDLPTARQTHVMGHPR